MEYRKWLILNPLGTSGLTTYVYSLLGEEGRVQVFPDNDLPEVQPLTGDGTTLFNWAKSLIKGRYINGAFSQTHDNLASVEAQISIM